MDAEKEKRAMRLAEKLGLQVIKVGENAYLVTRDGLAIAADSEHGGSMNLDEVLAFLEQERLDRS